MVSWSSLKQTLQSTFRNRKILQNPVNSSAVKMQRYKSIAEHDEHHHLELNVSRFHWHKFKDLLHFYAMLGIIPVTVITLFTNIFVGPAQLTQLPDDPSEEPKYWEYHKHPISRFIARYLHHSPQQDYEKCLHQLYEENEKALIRNLERKIRAKMFERSDYQAYTYRPVLGKYLRISKENADKLEELRGDV